jgi:2-polyprenyl-6-methoxyphenol hydroxylase-like FAD-dependent oxidoreductase
VKPQRIAIAGYGIAGIAAAVLLRRSGHEVVHFEQAPCPAFAGGGLLLQEPGLAVLESLGLRDAALACGAQVSRVMACDARGNTIMDFHYDEFEPGKFGLGVQRGALFRLLRSADDGFADLRTGHAIAGADAQGGFLKGCGGEEFGPFDLIVGADGVNSAVRGALARLVLRDRSYDSGAMLCLLDDPGGVFAGRVSQHFAGSRHVSVWPVGSLADVEPRRVNVSWRTPAGGTQGWKQELAQLCPAIGPLLAQSMVTPLSASYRDIRLRRYHHGRVVLLGDAAHGMSPQLGQGASMALLDAQYLAAALQRHDNVPAALGAFDRARRRHVETYQRLSRAVTPLFQSAHPVSIALRDRAFHPATRVAFLRRHMLKALGGRQLGLFGTFAVSPASSDIIWAA